MSVGMSAKGALMDNIKDKLSIIAIVVSVISLIMAVTMFVEVNKLKTPAEWTETQYVMYVGTNDKDTNLPKYSQESAREIVDKICLEYFEGYTLQEATGAWTDENKNVTHEYTIVCYFDDTDRNTVYLAADEIMKALNQQTVLIEQDNIHMEYYSGSED